MKKMGITTAVVLSITLGLLAVAYLGSSPEPTASAAGTITTCLNMTVPNDVAVNTYLDKTEQTLEMAWTDPTTSVDRTVRIRYVDPTCQTNSQVKPIIDRALQTNLEWMTETCQSLDRVSRGDEPVPTRGNVTLNAAAIPAFMSAHCTAGMLSASTAE